MNTTERLSNVQLIKPIWKGPESSDKMGGVTQSLLGKFLACPARFKVLVIDNLKPRSKFNHRIEYGNCFHLCDESYSQGLNWKFDLKHYVERLLIQYPFDQVEILKWWKVCQIQFRVYLDYWRDTETNKTSLLQEEVFHVSYKLPSGRIVYLRGKWDAIELEDGLWVYDTKTKSDVDKEKIERRLKYDLQMMLYLVALREFQVQRRKLTGPIVDEDGEWSSLLEPIRGIRYNVIKRPLSGGEGDIRQTKNETEDEFFDRLKGVLDGTGMKRTKENYTGPSAWFYRWESKVSAEDIAEFEKNTLIPCLERLCLWWNHQTGKPWTSKDNDVMHSLWDWTMPFGVYHISDEYGSDYDDYVISGSTIGLERCTELFPELQGVE